MWLYNIIKISPMYVTCLWITSWKFTVEKRKLSLSFSQSKKEKESWNTKHK